MNTDERWQCVNSSSVCVYGLLIQKSPLLPKIHSIHFVSRQVPKFRLNSIWFKPLAVKRNICIIAYRKDVHDSQKCVLFLLSYEIKNITPIL